MYNKVILMGRICHDLELKTTPSGTSVLSFRIAVDRAYQVKGEEKKTDFINIVAWRNNAEFISKYFKKGSLILVDGELQTRQYVDKNNVTQNIVEIIVNGASFTGEKAEASSPPNMQAQQQQPQQQQPYQQNAQAQNNQYIQPQINQNIPQQSNPYYQPQPPQQMFNPLSQDPNDDYPF